MENLFNNQHEKEQNNKSEFENFALINKTDLMDQNELNLIRGGGDEDIIDDWK